MNQKTIEEVIEGYKIKFVAEKTGINYSTLRCQLNPNHPRVLSYENELKIRQIFDNK